MASADLESFQKLGSKVFSSSLEISMLLASMSKIPPQRTKAFHKILNLIGCCHKRLIFFKVQKYYTFLNGEAQSLLLVRNFDRIFGFVASGGIYDAF